jgi:curved DNA-binding protein
MAVGSRDPYEALGVARDASQEEVRSAYRRLARENHPDVNKAPEAEDRFKEVSEAYEILRDPEKRAEYDRLGPGWRAARGAPPGTAGYGDGDVRVEFGDGDFADIFEDLFGGRGGRRRGGFSQRGMDREAVIELDLEEAARGGRRRLTLSDGREYDVDLPPGVHDGQTIRLSGEGGRGLGGGPGGDLLLRVRLRPHPRFRVRGEDLEVDLPVAPWEAALGAKVPVPTLEGDAQVTVPAGSSCGRRLRLRGAGLGGGDLYAVVKIVVPRRLSKRERRLFEELAEASKFDPRGKA